MELLFQIETDRVTVSFRALSEPARTPDSSFGAGLLQIEPLRPSLTFGKGTFRAGVPAAIAHDPALHAGPPLFEQVSYKLYARARAGSSVQIAHDDPLFCRNLTEEDGGGTVHGVVNFGSQIGRTEFTVLVDRAPELRVTLEVFPSKLDYRSDYEAILADIQQILTALALEYLRSTYQLGERVRDHAPTELEWVVLLRGVVDTLERALYHVAQSPVRLLSRQRTRVRADRVRRVDAAVRASIQRGAGRERPEVLPSGTPVPAWLPEERPDPTLDTPEHRWLAAQLTQIRRRLALLRRATAENGRSERHRKALADLEGLEARLATLSRLEPLAAARGEPPAGFASLPLLSAPGYREAYRACTVLSLGLRIEAGPLRLGVKDIAVLYEYWCYLETVRLLQVITGGQVELGALFAIRRSGLAVRLAKGKESEVRFSAPAERRISLQYNPLFNAPDALLPQQPDLLLRIVDPGWPPLDLVLDAKYRVDTSPSYRARYGAPGPPEDALNTLHRYRDAILAERREPRTTPSRTVVQAAALFPHREGDGEDFTSSRLFRSLEEVGVGALPLLPGHSLYLERWLRAALAHGAWDLSDRFGEHVAVKKAADWKQAASEVARIGPLRSKKDNPDAHLAHFAWIQEKLQYYMPLTKTQRRQFAARWVGIFSPGVSGQRGGVTHKAVVEAFEVVKRCEILTPWKATHGREELMILYHLVEFVELDRVIENRDEEGRPQRFSEGRWSSRLALERASMLPELFIETEPEWRLYEDLRARSAAFRLEAGPVRLVDPDNPEGRAWFRGKTGWSARYTGTSGFEWTPPGSDKKHRLVRAEDVAAAVAAVSLDSSNR